MIISKLRFLEVQCSNKITANLLVVIDGFQHLFLKFRNSIKGTSLTIEVTKNEYRNEEHTYLIYKEIRYNGKLYSDV